MQLERIGHWPDPLLAAPHEHQKGKGRWDLPGTEVRVVYGAETRLTAFLEREELQDLRSHMGLLVDVEQSATEYGPDPLNPGGLDELFRLSGAIPPSWFDKYSVAIYHPHADLRILDVCDQYVIEQLRLRLASWLIANHFTDFQYRDLLGDIDDENEILPVTQYIAQLAHQSGLAGIRAPSRCHHAGICWALFEGAAILPEATILPIDPADPALAQACRTYGLRLPPDIQTALDSEQGFSLTRQPRRVFTGDKIRGQEKLGPLVDIPEHAHKLRPQ